MSESREQTIELDVDGELIDVVVRPHSLLSDALRVGCGRTGVKEGCESASCGACTVLMDDKPILSCITLALDAVGRKIRTVEGLSPADKPLHPLQEAFMRHHAVQCGFCTPGMLLSAVALLEGNPHPSEDEIRSAISGNVCRCTGYVRIVHAIADVANASAGAASRRSEETIAS